MYKIAIVDDESEFRNQLKSYIEKYSLETGEQFFVDYYSDGEEIIFEYQSKYDIIFLDNIMKRMNGMEAAEKIRQLDKNVIIVFVTNMTQYAIRGYAVDALDYIVKPISYIAYSRILDKSIQRIRNNQTSFILIPAERGIVKLLIADICYIESYGHKVIVYTEKKEYIYNSTLKDIEKKLESKQFFRCNKGVLVNLSRVTRVKENIAHLGEYRVQISRNRKKEFMNILTSYVGGSM